MQKLSDAYANKAMQPAALSANMEKSSEIAVLKSAKFSDTYLRLAASNKESDAYDAIEFMCSCLRKYQEQYA